MSELIEILRRQQLMLDGQSGDDGGWTSVKDQMPLSGYLVAVAHRRRTPIVGQPRYWFNVAVWVCDEWRLSDFETRIVAPETITHWRLPPPAPAELAGHVTAEEAAEAQRWTDSMPREEVYAHMAERDRFRAQRGW